MLLETTATTRLPTTGPRVQKPIADARPSCGEKSRIRAGVATRMMPSTKPMTANRTAYDHLFGAFGMPKSDEQAGDQQAVDDEVGPAPPVGEPGGQRAERADRVAHHA